jgi:hypothetical protein
MTRDGGLWRSDKTVQVSQRFTLTVVLIVPLAEFIRIIYRT